MAGITGEVWWTRMNGGFLGQSVIVYVFKIARMAGR